MNLDWNLIMQIVFWVSLAGLIHTYAAYPLLMLLLRRLPTPDRPHYAEGDRWPDVEVVMAMYNEEEVIEASLRSILASDYPGRLQITVGSDGSTDASHEIVERIRREHPNLTLRIFPGRNGKITIINHLLADLDEDRDFVVIFCDANVTWTPQLARRLVRHFKDPKIGVVASAVIDEKHSDRGIAAEEEAYVNLENAIKHGEGRLWGRMMGAFGACYAVRGTARSQVPPHFNVDDFYQTIACYEQGYDGIVDLTALSHEAVSEEIAEEFRRKKRIAKGNFQNLKRFFLHFLPWNGGLAASFAFWSHKGLRWFGPLLIIATLITGTFLSVTEESWLHRSLTAGLWLSFLAIPADDLLAGRGIHVKPIRFVRYLYAMNAALLLGGIAFCRGIRCSIWEPTKRVGPQAIGKDPKQSNPLCNEPHQHNPAP